MLLEVKKYLQEKGDATLDELCTEFHVEDPEVMRQMLERLVDKGEVRVKQIAVRHCTKCTHCHELKNNDIYEWIKHE